MSSKAITEKPDPESPQEDWRPAREFAPSVMQADEPTVARWIGGIGLTFLLVGGAALVFNRFGWSTRIGTFGGGLCFIIGIVGLLYHAARDADMQIRRAYGFLGFLWLAAAILMTVWPTQSGVGSLFLPYGYGSLIMALLFLMPFARNETDPGWRRVTFYSLGAVGAVAALTGLIGGIVSIWFLLPYGLLLSVLGAAYLWAFVVFHGTDDDLGYRVGLAMGVAGAAVFVVALLASILPQSWLQAMSIKRPVNYLESAGLLLMAVGILYVALSAGLTSERQFVVLTRRELSAFFYSPLAYFVVFVFAIAATFQYAIFVFDLMRDQASIEPIVRDFIITWIPVLSVVVAVPLLTMRLFSEEHRTSTMEVLLTAPVREAPIVLSKFLAVLIVFLMTWLPYGLFLIALRLEGGQPFDYRPIISFTIALIACGAGWVSMGLFFSSLTRNQVVAGVFTAVGMVFFMALMLIPRNAGPNWAALVNYMSFINLWGSSLQGKLAIRDLLFPVSAAVFWLFVTTKVLESRTWR